MESYKDKVKKLCNLIKKVSDLWGGDDVDFLHTYCKDVVEENKDNLDKPITCFEELYKQAKFLWEK